jgi:hypothetical protein
VPSTTESNGSPDNKHPLMAITTASIWFTEEQATAGEDSEDEALFQYTAICPLFNPV